VATIEQGNEERARLTSYLSELANIKPEDLVRADVLGKELSFAKGVPYFERLLRLFQELHESNVDTLPYGQLSQLANQAQTTLQKFFQVRSFSAGTINNPATVRDNLVNEIADAYDSAFTQVSPAIAYSVRKGTDFTKLEREAQETIEVLRSKVADQETARLRMMSEIESSLEKVRRAAQEIGVAQHALHFRDEANSDSNGARKWLRATWILAILTLLFGALSFAFIYFKSGDFSPTQNVQLAIAKIIIFSVLLSATLWVGRIYKACRHNYVVNKHRQNALSTFETFAKAASDDATKSAVLLQATNCIFSAQQSGYVNQESETTGYTQILEIVRKVVEGHK